MGRQEQAASEDVAAAPARQLPAVQGARHSQNRSVPCCHAAFASAKIQALVLDREHAVVSRAVLHMLETAQRAGAGQNQENRWVNRLLVGSCTPCTPRSVATDISSPYCSCDRVVLLSGATKKDPQAEAGEIVCASAVHWQLAVLPAHPERDRSCRSRS